MKRIIIYGRWILLAVGILAAGFYYSSSLPDSRQSEPVQKNLIVKTDEESTGTVLGEAPAAGTISDSTGETEKPQETKAEYFVYVCGQVQLPGVYRLAEGSRVIDAVEAAGGFTEAADPEWLNLAEELCDGMKLRIPDREEVQQMRLNGINPDADEWKQGEKTSGKVNINTADPEELMTLPGIGRSKAEAICAYRRQYGGFHTIEDIMQVPGIKDAAFQKIRDHIMVSG